MMANSLDHDIEQSVAFRVRRARAATTQYFAVVNAGFGAAVFVYWIVLIVLGNARPSHATLALPGILYAFLMILCSEVLRALRGRADSKRIEWWIGRTVNLFVLISLLYAVLVNTLNLSFYGSGSGFPVAVMAIGSIIRPRPLIAVISLGLAWVVMLLSASVFLVTIPEPFLLNGSVATFLGIMAAIFGYRQLEQQYRNEVRVERADEAKLLSIQETHHRVKNNFASAVSLIELTRLDLAQGECDAVLANVQSRLNAASRVYSQLLREPDEPVDVGEYIGRLVHDLWQAYSVPPEARLHIDADPILVRPQIVLPVGLVLTELATNSIKYGIADRADSALRVWCHLVDHKTLEFGVADDGPGVGNADIDPDSTGLGLTLVQEYVRELRGQYMYRKKAMNEFVVCVPSESWSPRATRVNA